MFQDQHYYMDQIFIVTTKPLDLRSFPKDADMIPFPNEELTPPVTKIYLGNFSNFKNLNSKLQNYC